LAADLKVVVVLNNWPSGWSGERARQDTVSRSAGVSGTIDTERVRERAAELGEKKAVGHAEKFRRILPRPG
jgi:hypothetical protein